MASVPRIFPYWTELERPGVLWTGPISTDEEKAFKNQGLGAIPLINVETFDRLKHTVRALVVDVRAGALDWVRPTLNFVHQLFDHGVMVNIRVRDSKDMKETELATAGLRRIGLPVWHWETESVETIAARIARWTPGRAAPTDGAVPILEFRADGNPIESPLSPSETILLRRAFSDCRKLVLSRMTGGHSGSVFRVDAAFHNAPELRRALPFVAKFDRRGKVEIEFNNYWEHVNHDVPFHQRPMLDTDRSFLGYKCGLLVGTFVPGTEPLSIAVVRGHSYQVLHSLHESAISRWCAGSSVAKGNVVDALETSFPLDGRFQQSGRFEEFRAGGAKLSPEALLQKLKGLDDIAYRVGTVHGDLHGHNVQARGADAILIDFHSTRPTHPIAFDPAYLEVTTAFSRESHLAAGTFWDRAIQDLFSIANLRMPPVADMEPRNCNWLRNSTRQVRLFALANTCSLDEYARVLSYVLLRHATFCPNADEHLVERLAAYLTAERLIVELSS